MAVTKDIVSLEGTLRGEGRERKCRMTATRHTTYANECGAPTCVSYSRCEIEDTDDFPDGNYEVEFDAHRVAVTKKAGQYLLRSG
jgi:hypothetical protein